MKSMTISEFIYLVDEIVPNERGCKLWIGTHAGQGKYPYPTIDGRSQYGHRIVLEAKLGRKIRPKLLACHECDTPSCLSEEHLFEGSVKENGEDASRKGRIQSGDRHYARRDPEIVRRGERHHEARLTVDNVQEIRRLHLQDGVSKKELGERFGVSRWHVNNIICKKKWAHVL